ncbi:MAG: hypothetical protein LBR20_01260 [Propionibacteriaceae bacterium]|jgi:hypothetical protein|nr:hypothetical protein [Propionibacteriaceae bacterium]
MDEERESSLVVVVFGRMLMLLYAAALGVAAYLYAPSLYLFLEPLSWEIFFFFGAIFPVAFPFVVYCVPCIPLYLLCDKVVKRSSIPFSVLCGLLAGAPVAYAFTILWFVEHAFGGTWPTAGAWLFGGVSMMLIAFLMSLNPGARN